MAEVLTEVRPSEEMSAIEDLVAFLRSHPYRTDYSARDLAREYGLDPTFVGEVLEALRGSPNRLSSSESVKRALKTTSQSIGAFLKAFTDDFVHKPYLSLPLTLVMAIALMVTLRWLAMLGLLAADDAQAEKALESGQLIVLLAAAFLHGLCLFRNGLMRLVLYSSVWVLVASIGTLAYLVDSAPPETVTLTWPAILFVGSIIGVGYFGLFGVVSLIGAFGKSNRLDRRDSQMTRQQMLDRLFQIREKMRDLRAGSMKTRWNGLVPAMRSTAWLPLIGLATGIVVGVVGVCLRGSFVSSGANIAERYNSIPPVPIYLDTFIVACAFVSIGYLSGGLRRSLIALVLFFGGKLMAEAIPFSLFGPAYIEYLVSSGKLLRGLEWTLLLSFVLGIGSHIDSRARVRQKLQENDPAVLLAEMIEIHWRLNPSESATCVLVVDVAGSTSMKQFADPLLVEYSFRGFQDMVSEIACRRGGNVLSQAGDGAVVTFKNCPEALHSAKEIQTEIVKFNSERNRLDVPFRVRIGLHTGQTSADLATVPFNELIDIAAHVEREAPVGGIAVTESVVKHMEGERVAAMMEKIDGQSVYIVLDPTLAT